MSFQLSAFGFRPERGVDSRSDHADWGLHAAQRRAFASVFALAVLALVGCATDSGSSTSRELPTGLSPLGALLDGCTAEIDTHTGSSITRASCGGDVMLAIMNRQAVATEPHYRTEAYGLAQQYAGARLVWDQLIVPTEGPSGLVDRARAMVLDTQSALLLGTVRSLGDRAVQEVWCTAIDDAGDRRCRDLIGAVLAGRADQQAPAPIAAPPAGTAKSAPTGGAPATMFGRSISLPTSCVAKSVGDGGADVSCSDGATASWRKFVEMSEATDTVTATLAALGTTEDVEPEPFKCTIGGEPAQCEDHGAALAGLAYVDAKPVAVLCLASNAKQHALCRALISAK